MNFYVFYSHFSLHDSLENAISEHLEWLKLQTPTGELTMPPRPPSYMLCTGERALRLKI